MLCELTLDGRLLAKREEFLPPKQVCFVGHCVTLDTTLNKEVENWWKTESFGTKYNCDVSRSAEDERALKRLEETTNFRADLDHHETGLL